MLRRLHSWQQRRPKKAIGGGEGASASQ